MIKFRVQQTGSPIRRHHRQRETLIGLGLNRIGRIVEVPNTRETWGMIAKVRHLVRLPDEYLFEEHRLMRPQPQNENVDFEMVKKLVFGKHKVFPNRFKQKEMDGKKTPDFKLMKDGQLRGYCEVKSPDDKWVFDFPSDLKPDELRAEVRPDPAAPNLALHIEKAAQQFDSVNPDHALPNILAFVNHARLRGPFDLRHVLEGIQETDGRRGFLIHDKEEKEVPGEWQKRVWKAAKSIDLYVWIDAHKGTWVYRQPLGAKRLAEACDLLGIKMPEQGNKPEG